MYLMGYLHPNPSPKSNKSIRLKAKKGEKIQSSRVVCH